MLGKAWYVSGALVCDVEIEFITQKLGTKDNYEGATHFICESCTRHTAKFFATVLNLEWDFNKQKEVDEKYKADMDDVVQELKKMGRIN